MAGLAAEAVVAVPPGFTDPVLDSQGVFRAVLEATAHPGRICRLHHSLTPPGRLLPTTAAVLLALADFESCVWLDSSLADAAGFIRFHTGARITAEAGEAAFAVIGAAGELPAFSAFAQGSAEYPDRSATLLVQCSQLHQAGNRFAGPGIAGEVSFGFEPAPTDLPERMSANRALFPRGVDLLLFDAHHVAALPRSVRLIER